MRRMKRTLSLLLVLCMIFAMVPSFAAAAEEVINVATYTANGSNTAAVTYGIVAADDAGNYYVTTDGVADETVSYTQAIATEVAAGKAFGAWHTALSGKVDIYQSYAVTDTAYSGAYAANYYASMKGDVDPTDLTIDLHGNTITGPTSGGVGIVNPNATDAVTIKNGTITWYTDGRAVVSAGSSSDLAFAGAVTLDNLDLTQNGSFQAVSIRGAGTWILNGGKLTSNSTSKAALVHDKANPESQAKIYLMGGQEIEAARANALQIKVACELNLIDAKTTVTDETYDHGIEFSPSSLRETSAKLSGKDASGADFSSVASKATEGGKTVWTFAPVDTTVTYDVAVTAPVNGTVTASKDKAAEGENVTLTITPDAGFEIDTITVAKAEGTVEVSDNAFVMPAEAVTVTVTFKAILTYDVIIANAVGGTVTASAAKAAEGDTVTLTITADSGYEIESVTVTKAEGTVEVSNNTFVMPAEAVTVTVVFWQIPVGGNKVTVTAPVNGTVTTDAVNGYAVEGDTVTLTITPDPDFEIDTITVAKAEGTVEVSNNAFVMPAEPVTVTVTFKMGLGKALSYIDSSNNETVYYLGETDDPASFTYTTMQKAMQAAYDVWKANGAGTLKLYHNYSLAGCLHGSGNNSIYVTTGQNLVLDLNGYKMDLDPTVYRSGTNNYRMFQVNGADSYLEIKNGDLEYAGNDYMFLTGTSTSKSAVGTVKLTNVDTKYLSTMRAALYMNASSDYNFIIDGGSFISTNVPIANPGSVTEYNLILTGGVKVYCGSATPIKVSNGKLYMENADVYTILTGTTAADGYGIVTGTDLAEKVILGYGDQPSSIQISSTTEDLDFVDGEPTDGSLYKHVIRPLGSSQQKADSVAKIGNVFYNIDELVQILPYTVDGDIITAIADLDGTQTQHYASTSTLPVFDTTAEVTYEFGSYTVTANLAASAATTIKGGILKVSAPIELRENAVLSVGGNTVIDASSGAVTNGSGAITIKEAVVKFRTGTDPYGTVWSEGNYDETESNGVTTRTYTIPGDLVQGTNVALLVETERYFATLGDAVAAASALASESVKLVAETDEALITVGKGITIDLNGLKVLSEFAITNGDVTIKNGTIASATADTITVTGGNVLLSGLTIASTGNAVVVNGNTAEVDIVDSSLTGDSDSTDNAYALDVQAAAAVTMDNVTIVTGAITLAPVRVGQNVPYDAVTLNSGEVNVPKSYYELYFNWAQGREKIVALDSVSRYSYNVDVTNVADNSVSRNNCYIAVASAPAAMIGKTGYATFTGAIAAAKTMNNPTIVVMRDIKLADEFTGSIPNWLIDLVFDMTIDFNGHTLNCQDFAGWIGVFRLNTSAAKVTLKNGTINNLKASSTYTMYSTDSGCDVTLENMYIVSNVSCLATNAAANKAHVTIIGSTLESTNSYAFRFAEGVRDDQDLKLTVTGGSRLIGPMSSVCTSDTLDYSSIDRFNLDDAYLYSSTQVARYSRLQNVPEAPYMENGLYVYYFSAGNNPVAKIENTEYFSLSSALEAAQSGQTVVLQKDVTVHDAAVVNGNVTLDLNGKKVSFGTTGAMELRGNIVTNGGSVESNGQVAVKTGASIDGYVFTADAALNTKLNLSAVSLSLNEYVDVNLKYSETETADFNTFVVTANGTTLNLDKTANGYNVYKIEDLKAADYVTSYWVVMSANSGNTACVGMPVQVSVKEYAKKVVADTTNYGFSSNLGKTMTAMMDYAGVDMTEFAGYAHANTADFGTTVATSNDVLSVQGDLTNGFALKVTSSTAGVLRITHTDVYGATFVQNFDVANGETVTYDMIHVADAKKTVTITLLVNGAEASRLETTLASAANNADKAIIVSNMAEKLFIGN